MTVRDALWRRAAIPTLHFRRARMNEFQGTFNPTPAVTVLDVGGTPTNWTLLRERPDVTLLNIYQVDAPDYRTVVGDGTDLQYHDGTFDIVFSNSVIEHLGEYENQRRFAHEVRRVGKQLWIQTPAKGFPIEPHHMAPFIHWLPRSWQRRLVRNFTVYGWLRRPNQETVETIVAEYRLLTHREMRELFPDCEIRRERFFGLTKSFVAVRRHSPGELS
jgi:SAM-dependent methyltransferase